jgi:tRNA nucleotidyltransferase/poly(A) polymerase
MKLPFDTHFFPHAKGVYMVGGSVRDLLSGRTPVDYDLVVKDNPEIFAHRLADRMSAHVVKLGKPGQTVQRVITKKYFFDILPVAGADIKDDLARRDFTINAIALDLVSRKLIDPLGGQRDLAAGKIRMVSPNAFRNDPVRLIRAFRLAASFDLQIEDATVAAIANDARLIRHSAAERIRDEFLKILQYDSAWIWLERMAETGLLFAIFPELEALKKCQGSPEGGPDPFVGSLNACRHLEKLLNPRHPETVRRFYPDKGRPQSALLKMAVLFHAVGKASTAPAAGKQLAQASMGRLAARSAVRTGDICRRMRFSRRQSDMVVLLIHNHTRPYYLFRTRRHRAAVHKGLIRLFLECAEATDDVLLSAMAVFNGQKELADFFLELLHHYHSTLLPRALRPPVVTGQDLITEFGLKPSVLFAQILRRVRQESLLRDSLNRQQALTLVAEWLQQKKEGPA